MSSCTKYLLYIYTILFKTLAEVCTLPCALKFELKGNMLVVIFYNKFYKNPFLPF